VIRILIKISKEQRDIYMEGGFITPGKPNSFLGE
jgi:hypothetical protein